MFENKNIFKTSMMKKNNRGMGGRGGSNNHTGMCRSLGYGLQTDLVCNRVHYLPAYIFPKQTKQTKTL